MSKKAALLDAAEQRVRLGGYNNFSFRELAQDVGIKSASVHYHFATKADLAVALAAQYRERFFLSLGSLEQCLLDKKDPVEHFSALFKHALLHDQQMCLCGVLGAQAQILPSGVHAQVTLFFEQSLNWLNRAFQSKATAEASQRHYAQAVKHLALLQGGLMLSLALQDNQLFSLASEPTNSS